MSKQLLLQLALLCYALIAFCQQGSSQNDSLPTITSSALPKIYSNASHLKEKLDKKSEKILARISSQQDRILEKLMPRDSLAALVFIQRADAGFQQFQSKLANTSFDQYIPRLDSISTSLRFLQANPSWLASAGDARKKLEDAMARVKGLETSLQKAEAIKQYIRERKALLKEQFQKLGLTRRLKKINKEFFYYSQRLKDYKEALNDPKKAEKKILELLGKTKFFQDFLRKNSLLASLFRLPIDPNDPGLSASLGGLQTRAQVNNLIQMQLAAGGPNGAQQFQQNVQQAQSQLNQLKDKILKSGGSSGDDEMPDFKSNTQKTKPFFKRLEYSGNVQSQKASSFFPVTSDIGLSVGYKLNDHSIIGLGVSYKIGFGRGWEHIRVTNEGLGIRSFVDIHLKGSLWITGGYEQNYRTAFNDIALLRDHNAWQESGLIGLSKSIPVRTRFFKKTKIQLLLDFLSYEQVPRTQPVVFRVGYNF